MNKATLFYEAAAVIISTYVIARVIKWFVSRGIINNIPGPYSHYFTGNITDMIGTPEDVFKNLRRFASKYSIYRLWMGYVGIVGLHLPEDIEIVISSMDNLEKSQLYWLLLPWLGTGLLTSTGEKWHNRRKILTPAFHFNVLQQFVTIFTQQTRDLIEKLEQHHKEPYIDIVPYITEFTLHSINETAMGTKLDEKDTEQVVYKESIYEFSELVIYRLLRPWFYNPITWIFHPMSWRERKLVRKMHNFTNNVINQRKIYFSGKSTNSPEQVKTSKPKSTMLDLLLTANENGFNIDDEGIREEVDTFTFEGHDTTSMSISFTLLLLASHQDIQEKVYQEIVDVVGDMGKLPTFHDLTNLKYLEMCIKESLRLYPSVPMISRILSKDVVTSQGYKLTKDTIVLIHIYDLHHNPDIYPDPEQFDPDRFLPENTVNRHPFAYLPFSGGPRNCIGQKFAMLELKSVIAGILSRYKLIPVDNIADVVIAQEMVLRPKNGIKIKFEARN